MKEGDKAVDEHGLSSFEHERVIKLLGRTPNEVELGIFSVMWSECYSYKSSKIYLDELPTEGKCFSHRLGDSVQEIKLYGDDTVTIKIGIYNRSTSLEACNDIVKGVGDIFREMATLSARPVALLGALKFGDVADHIALGCMKAAVQGIVEHSRKLDVSKIGGEVAFDSSFNSNMLINLFAIGLVEGKKGLFKNSIAIGNHIIYAKVKPRQSKPDGHNPEEPFEKKFLGLIYKLLENSLVVGLKDIGKGCLVSSLVELVCHSPVGLALDLDRIPVEDGEISAGEILLSGSDGTLLVAVDDKVISEVENLLREYNADFTIIGSVVENKRIAINFKSQTVVDIPILSLVNEVPIGRREPIVPRDYFDNQNFDPDDIEEPSNLEELFINIITHPNFSSKAWIFEDNSRKKVSDLYADATVVGLKNSKRGIVVKLDSNPRYCYLDPYAGAALTIAESARNLSAVGAYPKAISYCLNFGDPDDPAVIWQLQQTTKGMRDACRELNIPITVGDASLNNSTDGRSIFPTPVVAMIGAIDDVDKICAQGWRSEDDIVILLGFFEPQIGSSEYLCRIHNMVRGRPPYLNLEHERAVQYVCRTGISRGFIRSAHDISDGGLLVALAGSSFLSREKLGVTVVKNQDIRNDAFLFGETASSMLVSVEGKDLSTMLEIAQTEGVPAEVIGRVGGQRIKAENLVNIGVEAAYHGWIDLFRRHF